MLEVLWYAFKPGEPGFLFSGTILICFIAIILETIYKRQKHSIRFWSMSIWLVFIVIYAGWTLYQIFSSSL
jgi:hypothetical protein